MKEDTRSLVQDQMADQVDKEHFGADLRNRDFSEAHLSGVFFGGANLENADFRNADLRGTEFVAANLGGASLKGADLRLADLSKANLENADLAGAVGLDSATFWGARFNALTRFPEGFDPFAHYLTHLDRTSAYRPHAPLPPKKNPAPAPQPQREEPIPESDLDFVFMKEKGDFWRVRMSDSETLVSDCKGLTYIHYLLRHEGDWVSSMQLLAATDPEAVEMEDRRRREQRQRIRDAQADARESLSYLSGSSSSYDSDELQQAKEFYEEELRDVQDQIKAFHKNVYNRISNNIRRSLENFEKALPELAQHLSDTIKYRGQEWLYNPPSGEQIDWTLG